MAYAAWLNIPVDHGRSGPVFRVWDAVNRLLSGAMAGKWTIVDTSEGATPAWTNDTSPADGAWVVIQCETPWNGGAKLQVFLGFRATTGNLAGFGSKTAGLYCAFSTDGGFDTTAHYFGTSLADWRNGSLVTVTGYTTACVMSLFLNSGATDRAGSFGLLTRTGTTAHNHSFGVFAVVPPLGLAESKARAVIFYGTPSTSWIDNGGIFGRVVNTAIAGYSNAKVIIIGDYAQDRDAGVRVEGDLLTCMDITTGTNFGLLPLVYRCSAADGDVSVDGTRWIWKGMSTPREAARDGAWV